MIVHIMNVRITQHVYKLVKIDETIKAISNKRTAYDGRERLLGYGRLKGRGVYKIFSEIKGEFNRT